MLCRLHATVISAAIARAMTCMRLMRVRCAAELCVLGPCSPAEAAPQRPHGHAEAPTRGDRCKRDAQVHCSCHGGQGAIAPVAHLPFRCSPSFVFVPATGLPCQSAQSSFTSRVLQRQKSVAFELVLFVLVLLAPAGVQWTALGHRGSCMLDAKGRHMFFSVLSV
jgi:hypothetical protein